MKKHMKKLFIFGGIILLIFITSCGCDNGNGIENNNSGEKYQYIPQSNDDKYRGVDDRTEENVDEWQYDGSRSEDGIDWEFLDKAREAYFAGE